MKYGQVIARLSGDTSRSQAPRDTGRNGEVGGHFHFTTQSHLHRWVYANFLQYIRPSLSPWYRAGMFLTRDCRHFFWNVGKHSPYGVVLVISGCDHDVTICERNNVGSI
jgi:hypothetical protein